MKTLALGHSNFLTVRAFSRRAQVLGPARGFTLLELLVVLVILSIAAGLLTLRATPGDLRYLQADAKRLVQILRVARQHALLNSQEIRFIPNAQGFRFEQFDGRRWLAISDEPLLRERAWEHGPLQVTLELDGQPVSFLRFQPNLSITQARIVLALDQNQVRIRSRPGGLFLVETPS